jgi:hypothetical protein
MYWLSVSKLEEDFREGRVDEKEKFKYYLGTFVAWYILAQIFFHLGGPFEIKHLIIAAFNLTIIIVGIDQCYMVNSRGHNTDFIPRMICLGFTLSIIFAVTISVLFFAFSLFSAAIGHEPLSKIPDRIRADLTRLVDMPTFFLVYYFWQIHSSLIRINPKQEPVQLPFFKAIPKKSPSAERIALMVFWGIVGGTIVGFIAGPGSYAIYSLGIPEPYNFELMGALILTFFGFCMLMYRRRKNANR